MGRNSQYLSNAHDLEEGTTVRVPVSHSMELSFGDRWEHWSKREYPIPWVARVGLHKAGGVVHVRSGLSHSWEVIPFLCLGRMNKGWKAWVPPQREGQVQVANEHRKLSSSLSHPEDAINLYQGSIPQQLQWLPSGKQVKAGKYVGTKNLVSGNANWSGYRGNQLVWSFSKKLKIELPCNPIRPLHIYPWDLS